MKFQEFMNNSLIMGLYRSYHQNISVLVEELKKESLNLNQSLILLAIFFENNEGATPTQLQKTLFLGKDQISHELRKLETHDWIRRKISPHDSRSRLIFLTSLGKQKASKLVGLFNKKEEDLETKLSKSLESFV